MLSGVVAAAEKGNKQSVILYFMTADCIGDFKNPQAHGLTGTRIVIQGS
jgi:hypothetical protein